VEKRYSQTEKESLAIVWGCEHFSRYLLGVDFDLVTDHRPLERIYSPTSRPSARIERWVLRLQPYTFRVIYRPGKANIADALSRLLPQNEGKSVARGEDLEDYVNWVAEHSVPVTLTLQKMEEESAKDPYLQEVKRAIQTSDYRKLDKKTLSMMDELTCLGDLILRGTRIMVPRTLQKQILDLAHERHQGIVRTKQRLRTKVYWPTMCQEVEETCKTCFGCTLVRQPQPPTPLQPRPMPNGPWKEVSVDLMDVEAGYHLLVVTDGYSRYMDIEIMKSTTTTTKVIRSLQRIFAAHGIPEIVRSDNGPQFISEELLTKELQNTGHKETVELKDRTGHC
jgi:hypothetical protein